MRNGTAIKASNLAYVERMSLIEGWHGGLVNKTNPSRRLEIEARSFMSLMGRGQKIGHECDRPHTYCTNTVQSRQHNQNADSSNRNAKRDSLRLGFLDTKIKADACLLVVNLSVGINSRAHPNPCGTECPPYL